MQTGHLALLTGLWLILLSPAYAQKSDHDRGDTENFPSGELLEFLADFGEMDEETFKLIEFHALQDKEKARQEKSDAN